MATGTVKWFNPTKGYGFIQPQGGGKDVFVHISAVERAGLSTLNEGQHVEYEIVEQSRQELGGKSQGEMNKLALDLRPAAAAWFHPIGKEARRARCRAFLILVWLLAICSWRVDPWRFVILGADLGDIF